MKPAPKALRANPQVLRPARPKSDDGGAWLEAIKKQARANLDSSEAVRIAWTNRFGIPRYPSFGDYTPEEAVLELWEQHYFEHPDSIELQGIYKRRHPKTGLVYYQTGDPLLDAIEEAFGRGERPNFAELDRLHPSPGADVFREPVFLHDKSGHGADGRGFVSGQVVAPLSGLEGVQENSKGEKMAGGSKVHHKDFSSDDWLKGALAEDSAMAALASKLGDPPSG